MKNALKAAAPSLTDTQTDMFGVYYDMLTDWNSRMNLTAITGPKDVAEKHFADSILPASLIGEGASVIDVGTGAGFPGVPLLIVRPDIKLTLLDSLDKRLKFLTALLCELGLSAETVHARAEDGGRDPRYRERFDIALSRAVAQTGNLLEYTVPFLKTGGASLMYKGQTAKDELKAAGHALSALRCKADVISYDVPWGERCVIRAVKQGATAPAYPRTPAAIKKKPL